MEETRKKALIFFAIILVAFAVDIIVPSLIVKIIAELVYFILAIVEIVFSIKLIKKKDYYVGITLLVLSCLIILMLLVAFFVGFIIGILQAVNNADTLPL